MARPPSSLLPLLLLLLPTFHTHAQHLALSCSQHPAYRPTWLPPLLRSFTELPRPAMFERILYHPHLTTADYHPLSDPTSTIYHSLDLFFSGGVRATDALARLHLHRPATLYLFVGASAASAKRNLAAPVRLPGWRPEGWAELPNGSRALPFGLHQTGHVSLQRYAYVFSKPSAPGLTALIPSDAWVRAHLVAPFSTIANFHVRLAERDRDRSPSPPTPLFEGRRIPPNTACPADLHRAWAVPDGNPHDEDTKAVRFGSWHPAWDPCFACSYGHEHGSSPLHLMGYAPKFDLAAWKNGREDETDAGFKAFVLQQGEYMFYFGLHAQASTLRRVTTQYHTVTVAITHAKTKELMYEVTHKADFGFLAARGKAVDFVPLTKHDDEMMLQQKDKWVRRRFRSINVIDENNLDPRFRYRPDPIDGVYEEWVTLPICAWAPPFGEIIVDLKAPGTGIKSANKNDEAVKLGRFSRNVGAARSIRMKDTEFSGEHCQFLNSNETASGYFYTDPRGQNLLDGPGRGAIRQYVKEGFRLKVSGSFEVAELGLGLHADGVLGFFTDHSYGLDPDLN